MDTIFANYGNSKTSDPHRLLLNKYFGKNKLRKKWQTCCFIES